MPRSPAPRPGPGPAAPPASRPFRVGVATAGFQIEGGYNGAGEPRNNWYRWEAEGRVEPSGTALGFWEHPEEVLDRAVAAGCDSLRLSVEWARCEPANGRLDVAALDRYGAILAGCQERGLEPLVTLHHFTHPAWLGEDFWLDLDAPARFADWVAAAVDRLGEWCTAWVTVNEPNIWALQTYLTGDFPPGRLLSIGHVVRSLDHLLAAHVLAHDAIKARQPDALVATNTFTFSLYELDRLLVDLLLARHHGVARADLREWLLGRRAGFEAAMEPFAGRERLLRVWAKAALPLELAFPRTVSEVYASAHERSLDVVQLDHYDPVVSNHLRLPGRRTAGGRWWHPSRPLWDDPPAPACFARCCELAAADGLPVWIVENGLCNRIRKGHSYERIDGWDRPRYLRAHLGEVVRLLERGVPIEGYWHWTLADNYEWGSYEPRFGLYGIDRERGCRWLDTDSLGDDSAGEYRRLADEVRAAAARRPTDPNLRR